VQHVRRIPLADVLISFANNPCDHVLWETCYQKKVAGTFSVRLVSCRTPWFLSSRHETTTHMRSVQSEGGNEMPGSSAERETLQHRFDRELMDRRIEKIADNGG
jgi:hypothetical protein